MPAEPTTAASGPSASGDEAPETDEPTNETDAPSAAAAPGAATSVSEEPTNEASALTADPEAATSEPDDATNEASAESPVAAAVPRQTSRLSVDREHTRALFIELQSAEDGDPKRQRARDSLVEAHLPLVEHLARRFRNRGEPYDDLVQVATIGLIKSVDRFDLGRGVEFSTYATPTIVGEIKRHFRDKGWAVRVPRRLQELRLSLASATSELSQKQGRAPTVNELALYLKISDEDVLEGLESANAYSTLSLDAGDSGSDDEPMPVSETLGVEDEALVGVEYRESLKPMLGQLAPREKTILLLRFFKNMTQSEIAAEVGISQMHVSRLLARTLAQLREGLFIDE